MSMLALTPTVSRTLQHDMQRGVWSPVTQHFFEQLARLTPTVSRTLQHDMQRGVWSPVTQHFFEQLVT